MKGGLIRGSLSSLLILLVSWSSLFAHSGGTDRYGCHAGSEPYHCHNSGRSRSSGQDTDPAIQVVTVIVMVALLFWLNRETTKKNFAYVRPIRSPAPQLELSESLQQMRPLRFTTPLEARSARPSGKAPSLSFTRGLPAIHFKGHTSGLRIGADRALSGGRLSFLLSQI